MIASAISPFRVFAINPGLPVFSRVIFAWLALASAAQAAPASVDAVLKDALAAEARWDVPAALRLFKEADALRPNDPVILQKISKQYSDSTHDVRDAGEQKQLCTTALAYAQRAFALQPDNAVNVLSLAICYGKLATLSDTRTKLEYSRHVKEYAERALVLDPKYDYAHHVLGRWHYEVATLGAGARWIVKLIYGGLPPASNAEAVRELQLATELGPDKPSHRVELGLAQLADSQRDAARATLEFALRMPPREKHDNEAFARARAGLEKLR
jgi:tetratricopeptide (TPR) repeat protein